MLLEFANIYYEFIQGFSHIVMLITLILKMSKNESSAKNLPMMCLIMVAIRLIVIKLKKPTTNKEKFDHK